MPIGLQVKYTSDVQRSSKTRVMVTRVIRRGQQVVDEVDWPRPTTPAERMAMMWQLALDAWAFKEGGTLVESRLPRHIVFVQRRES